MNTEHANTTRKQYVMVDTSVFRYSLSKDRPRSEAVLKSLKELATAGYRLAISEYTIYESLRNQWGKKAGEVSDALLKYEWRVVSTEVLKTASQLHGLYHDEGIDNVSDGDKIIAATAILEGGFVFTRNHKDFPNPFFTPKQFIILPIHLQHHTEHMDLALYEPNFDLLTRRINERSK